MGQSVQMQGGGRRRATDPVCSVDIHKIDYHIISQGLRVYYLKAPDKRQLLSKRSYLLFRLLLKCVCHDFIWCHMSSCVKRWVLFCSPLVYVCCGALNTAYSSCVFTSVCWRVYLSLNYLFFTPFAFLMSYLSDLNIKYNLEHKPMYSSMGVPENSSFTLPSTYLFVSS